MRACTKCGEEKPLDQFSPDRKGRGGLHSHCKACKGSAMRARYDPAVAAAHRARPDVASRDRRYRLMAEYGLSPEQWDALVLEQEGRCASCGDPADLVVDHEHNERARIRGLCDNCNRGLGCFRDDPARLRSAAAYLERNHP